MQIVLLSKKKTLVIYYITLYFPVFQESVLNIYSYMWICGHEHVWIDLQVPKQAIINHADVTFTVCACTYGCEYILKGLELTVSYSLYIFNPDVMVMIYFLTEEIFFQYFPQIGCTVNIKSQ